MSILKLFFVVFLITKNDAQIIRTVYCGNTITGYVSSMRTDYYKVINIPYSVTSIQFNSCQSSFDTYLQVLSESFGLLYEWYVDGYIFYKILLIYILLYNVNIVMIVVHVVLKLF